MQVSALKKKRLKSPSHEAWHPRSTPTSGAGSGASQVMSFFLANNTGAPQGEVFCLLKPMSNNSCNWTLSSCNSTGAILCGVIEIEDVLGCNSIMMSTSLCAGNLEVHLEKCPHTHKPPKVNQTSVSPRPPR